MNGRVANGWCCAAPAVGVALVALAVTLAACRGSEAKMEAEAQAPNQNVRPVKPPQQTSADAHAQAAKEGAREAGAQPVVEKRVAASAAADAISVDPVLSRDADLYAKFCAICHGEQGDGAGKFAYLMNPRPRNFQQGNFKLATTENQIPSDADLLRTISSGMPGSAMPPWGHLPRTDLEALVKSVRKFNADASEKMLRQWVAEGSLPESDLRKTLAARTQPGASLMIPPEPPFDDIRWFRGRKTYLENCASCHGADGQPVADAVKFDAEGFPVPPRSFVNGVFKGTSRGHQLYARIWKGMKGTPMPASEGVYSPDEVWDLIHYVQSLARQGAQERAQLAQGTITAPNVRGTLPDGPKDSAWEQARPVYVGLTPLWWTENRIEGLVVQALHNSEELAIRMMWIDPTADDRAVGQGEFRDAVAIQFSMSSDPPFYMGGAGDHGGVNIWMWKADRQTNITSGYQDVDAAFPARAVDRYPEQDFRLTDMSVVEWPHERITKHDPQFITAWGAGNLVANPTLTTPVECLTARGPGTLSGKPADLQLVEGKAVYERGVWYVQVQRSLALPHGHEKENAESDERAFNPGDYLPVSFAVWNGSAGDRDGKKNISIWQKLVIE